MLLPCSKYFSQTFTKTFIDLCLLDFLRVDEQLDGRSIWIQRERSSGCWLSRCDDFYGRDERVDETTPKFISPSYIAVFWYKTRLYILVHIEESVRKHRIKVYQTVSHKENPLEEKNHITHIACTKDIVIISMRRVNQFIVDCIILFLWFLTARSVSVVYVLFIIIVRLFDICDEFCRANRVVNEFC